MTNTIDQLKTEVNDIKKWLDELKSNVSLSDLEKKNKAEALKTQVDTTKHRIENEINSLKDKTDDESKKAREEAEALLYSFNETTSLYNSIISPVTTNSTEIQITPFETKEKSFLDKSKDWVGKQWSDIWDKDKWHEEWGKNLLRTAWFVATWIWAVSLAVKWIKKLFWKDKKKEKSDEEEKWFWDKRYWKALKWTWIWAGVYFLINHIKGEKKDWPSTAPWSNIERSEKAYDKLSAEDKKIYESSAIAINEYQWNIMWDGDWSNFVEDLMWDSKFDWDKIWLIPFMLWNRYDSLDKMLSETSFYYEIIGTEWHIVLDKLKNFWLDWLKKLLTPLVWAVNWLTADLLNLDDWLDKLIDRLKWVEWLEWILRTVFRKSITVMSYYQSRKWALEVQLAEKKLLESDPKFANLSERNKAEEISDHLQDSKWYTQYIEPEVSKFMKLNLKDSTKYLQEKWLLNGRLDRCMEVAINEVDEKKNKLLQIEDDDDTSVIEDMKSELNNWKLPEKLQKKLKDLCDDFEEDVFTMGKQSWYAKYLPMLEVFDGWDQLIRDIQQCWDYENIANKYKEQIDSILKKSENWTLQESDLDLLEETINDYYKFQKSLVSSEINISKSVDERWNIVVRRTRSIWAGWQNIGNGVQMVFEKKEWSRIEGVWLIAGWVLSIDALTFWLAGKITMGHSPFWELNKKVVFPVAKGGLRITGQWIERLTWNTVRANLPSRVSYKFYDKDTFRIAVWRWDISLEKAAKIAKKQWLTFWNWNFAWNWKLVETSEDVIQYLFWSTPEEAKRIANITEKYWNNSKIYRELFPEYYQNVAGKRRKPQERLHLNRSNMKFNVNESALQRLENIATRIDSMPAWTQKTVLQSMMRSVRSVDQAEDFAIMWVSDDMARLLESWKFIKPEQYWKYLAKYAGKINVEDVKAFEKFIVEAKNAGKTWENSWLFVRNAMRNFWKLKENHFAIDKIDDLALNSNRRTKLAESTKANCTKMTSRLREMVKNPKFKPFHGNIAKQADAVEEFSRTVTPEWMKAMKNISSFGKETAFARLSTQWMAELSKLNLLLKNVDTAKDLGKALRWAKTLDNVKDILMKEWIAVNHIDDAVLLKIAKTSDVKKIKDIVNYWAEYKAIQWAKKLFENPAFKMAWRVWWKVLVAADFALVWYNFYSQFNEAQAIKQYNLERWERKEWQSYFELWTWALWAAAGVCMFIPWAWWIAWWVLLASMAVMEIWNKYFEDIEKFKQNQADFLAKWIAATKQELTSIDSWDQWLSRTWIDNLSVLDSNFTWMLDPVTYGLWKLWASSVNKKKEWVPRTKADALQALIRMEEIQKNPLAGADLNDPEVIKNTELMEAIRLAKEQVEEIVEKRFNYFKSNYLDQNKPLIEKSNFDLNQALSSIETSLEMSSIAAVMDSDKTYTWENSPEKYKEAKLKELKTWNKWNFSKLEKIYEDNPISLFQMYGELPYYRSMLLQYWENDQMKLLDACDYFEQYISYKMLWKSLAEYPVIDIDSDNIDYNNIHNLLSHFALIPTTLNETEMKDYKWLSDADILDKYWISGILWQDILFECAKLLNYDGSNSLDELKQFFHESRKEIHWIYYDGKQRVINENNAKDDKFAKDSELNSLENIWKMRKCVNANVNSWWNGKMFTESWTINKEMWNKILSIISH